MKGQIPLFGWQINPGQLYLVVYPFILDVHFRLPNWVIKCIDRIRGFLWIGPNIERPKARLVNWKRLCLSQEQGWLWYYEFGKV